MEKQTWKIGEIAKLTGITVRTLHHYDQIGLLSPSENRNNSLQYGVDKDLYLYIKEAMSHSVFKLLGALVEDH